MYKFLTKLLIGSFFVFSVTALLAETTASDTGNTNVRPHHPPPGGPGGHHPGHHGQRPPDLGGNAASDTEAIANIETKITEWATEKGYTTEKDTDGKLIVKNGDGEEVKIPSEVLPTPPDRGGHERPPMPPEMSTNTASGAESIANIEAKITEWATEKGYTTEKSTDGKLVVKDSDGKEVKIPPEVLPAPPDRGGHRPPKMGGDTASDTEMIANIEAKITEWATEKGYTTEKNTDGKLVVKDSDGKEVKIPPEVLPAPPDRGGHRPPKMGGNTASDTEMIANIETKITEWATEKGYTTAKDENGRLVVKDADGKIVQIPPEVLPKPPMPPDGLETATSTLSTGDSVTSTESGSNPEETIEGSDSGE